MVEQTYPGSRTLPPGRADRQMPAAAAPADPGATSGGPSVEATTAPYLLVLVLTCLFIPGQFHVGVQLSPYRMVLLAMFPLLIWHWINGRAGRPNAVDVLMMAYTGWIGLALIANHGLGAGPRAVILFVELFGGYLIGRMLIRNMADYRLFFRFMTVAFAILLPLAVIEMVTSVNIPRRIFDIIFTIPPRQSNLGLRLGLVRSQGVFEHPILWGMVASLAVANVLYIYRDQFVKSVRLAIFFVFMVFTSISSGPMLSVIVQLLMVFWDRTLWFLSGRWILAVALAAFGVLVLRFVAQFEFIEFVRENLMFNPQTADGRLVILEYGTAEVLRNPVFGIGLADWVRPWDKGASFDNFWLGQAMRFGIPSLLFLMAALGVSFARIASQSTLSPQEVNFRTGYLITLTGLTVTLGTVNIWAATNVIISLYWGAGAWFYMRGLAETDDPDGVRARRLAQAQAFAGAATGGPGSGPRPGTGPGALPGRATGPVRGRTVPGQDQRAPGPASGTGTAMGPRARAPHETGLRQVGSRQTGPRETGPRETG